MDAQQSPARLAAPGTSRVKDVFTPTEPGNVRLTSGFLGDRVEVNEKSRLLHVDEDDMLDAFERREMPHQDWQGEHVGKFLHAATLAWASSRDSELKSKLDRVVGRLLKTQEADGYLGTYVGDHRWKSWDVWVHKYDLLGLLTYYQYTRDLPDGPSDLTKGALDACRKVGDLLVRTFGDGPGQRDINKAGEHVGMAADSVLEPIVLLYRATSDPRYLKFAEYIVKNYDAPGGPAILTALERTKSVRKVANAKAYEMTSNFNGLLELYRATGEKRLLNAMLTAWDDIARNRLYLTGSASSYELFQDDFQFPNENRSNICETCVTVTWEQMNMQLLRLTGDARFAEEIERSALNHLLGAQKPTGDDWAYYTPLAGRKPYDTVTTCCHSSGPRGVALLPEVAVMLTADNGLVINLYNAGDTEVALRGGKVKIEQKTNYPLNGAIMLAIAPERKGMRFPLRLRIPSWATDASVKVNGVAINPAPSAGSYAKIERRWAKGDKVTLDFSVSGRLAIGDHRNEGKAAVLYGPLVLALDTALNAGLTNPARAELATSDPQSFKLAVAPDRAKAGELVFAAEGKTAGSDVRMPLYLTPFATAGQDGKSTFAVWIALPGKGALPAAGSLIGNGQCSFSRNGNLSGDINDGDVSTYFVTYNTKSAEEDWYAIALDSPVEINRAVFAHGHCFHDGGWFDVSGGKPRIQVQTERNGEWKTVATLESYPNTTAIENRGLEDGRRFEVKFAPVKVFGVRVVGKPASGDRPEQAFSSCAELQAFFDR